MLNGAKAYSLLRAKTGNRKEVHKMKRWMFLGLVAIAGLLWLACNGDGGGISTDNVSSPHNGEATHEDGDDTDHEGGSMNDGMGGGMDGSMDGGMDGGMGAMHITLDEWSISGHDGGNAMTIDAGEVVLEVHNEGGMPHALALIRTDLDPAGLPIADGAVDAVAAGEVVGEIEEFPGGGIQVGTFHMTPGKYVLACDLPGHYQQGMYFQITVE
jgi:hypothetical protein